MSGVAERRVEGRDLACRLWSVPSSASLVPAAPLPTLCSLSSRLGLDDAAGPRAENPGPGPQRGSAGEEVGLASHACLLSAPWTSPIGEGFFLGALYFLKTAASEPPE